MHTFRGPSGFEYMHNSDFSGRVELAQPMIAIPFEDIEALYLESLRRKLVERTETMSNDELEEMLVATLFGNSLALAGKKEAERSFLNAPVRFCGVNLQHQAHTHPVSDRVYYCEGWQESEVLGDQMPHPDKPAVAEWAEEKRRQFDEAVKNSPRGPVIPKYCGENKNPHLPHHWFAPAGEGGRPHHYRCSGDINEASIKSTVEIGDIVAESQRPKWLDGK